MRPRRAVLLTTPTVDPRLPRFAQFWCNINPFRINTCKTVSKQTTLSPLRINTYEKQAGWGRAPISSFPRAYHVRHLPHKLTPFLSNSCELFCTFLHRANTHLLCFQAIPNSLPKNTGGGGRGAFQNPTEDFCPAVAACSVSQPKSRGRRRGELREERTNAARQTAFITNGVNKT
jgi:hypothetical protein